MTSSFPGSLWMPVPGFDVFSTNTHRAIVIHKTASPSWPTAQAVAQGFINEAPGASVHYIVGRDGVVVQCVSEDSGAGGNCCLEAGHDTYWDDGVANKNTETLSIEHVDTASNNSTPCTQAQLDSSFALVSYLCNKWGISADNIKPHSSLDPIDRARCPGNYPFSDLVSFIRNGGVKMGVPAGWSDDGTILTAPNSVKVVLGFRQYILNNAWASNNWPLAPEETANPVEIGWNSTAGSRQFFLYNELAWTPQKGVYVVSVGREAYACLHPHPSTGGS